MNTLCNKLLCAILSLALLINLLPVSVLASEATLEQTAIQYQDEDLLVDTTENAEQQLITEVPEENSAVIVQEDISLRNEFTKHFVMSDGSYTATVYNEPVHQLVDGAWVEVDNTLTLSTSAEGVAKYQTVNGLADVSFAQTFGNELVTMEQDEHSITWGVAPAIDTMEIMAMESAKLLGDLSKPVQAEILTAELSDVSAEEQRTFATKATSRMQYSDALANGVNLEYTVLPSRIKESIILDSPKNISAYTVTVNTSNLSARLLDNREVEFYTADGETVFTMWAPYMYDSASELSEDIAVELAVLGNGQYVITLTPDAAWLNSPDRVYPIVIDPDVSVSRARTNIIDNTVMEGQGNQNRNLDRLYIGRKSGACVRAFLKYDVMPTIPANATITEASQTLYITSGTDTGSTAGAYIVTGGDWASDTITWANRPAATTAIQTSISHNNFSYYHFSCLSAVQKWYTGSTIGKNANYGITVRYTNETINDYNAFYSADYSVESSRPLLEISYWVPSITVSSDIELVEGETYQLTPTIYPAGQTVTWTTTDASIATVSSNGMVTGKKAGVAVITATLPNGDYDCCMTLVTLSNGVYYIGNSGLYLGTDGGLEENTPTKLFGKTSARPAQLRLLWKIQHLGNGEYSIRPMYKLDMALHVTSNSVDITTIGALDSSVPAANRWRISYRANGYLFRPADAVTKAIRPINSTVYIGL